MNRLIEDIGGVFRQIGGSVRSLFSRRSAGRAPAITKVSSVSPSVSRYSTAPSRRAYRHRRVRVRDSRRFAFFAAAAVVVVALAVTLPLLLTTKKDEVVSAPGGELPFLPAGVQAAASLTLAVPPYAELSLSEGVSADVVGNVQSRLMELGYMDEDDPDGNYSDATRIAVEHFQQQAGLPVTGTVDQATMDALNSPDAQEYTIAIGTENDDVRDVQERLYELGYIAKVTGYFGTNTESAIKKFQKLNDLAEDGKVNNAVRELLYSEDAVSNAYSYGDESPDILNFQKRLKALGYLTTTPDGKFGPDTRAAVKRFQENSGLVADGYIGPATKEALMSSNAQGNALTIGAEGADVENVQRMLKKLNYMSKVTGYFGSTTDSAVRSFQNNNGLKVDGKVGKKTMALLTSDKAKKSTGVNITGANASSFVEVAKSKLGSKYVRGAKGPNKFDCSGFVYWCLNKVGVKQGYMTSRGWAKSSKYTKIKSINDLKKGDIIVFEGHVGIIAGGGMMIDASSSNGKVVRRSYTSSWCKRMFICGFRVF